jgi:hypothetical protein
MKNQRVLPEARMPVRLLNASNPAADIRETYRPAIALSASRPGNS